MTNLPPHQSHGHGQVPHNAPTMKTIPKKPFFSPFWIGFGAVIGGYMLWKERRNRLSDWAVEDKSTLEARFNNPEITEEARREVELAIAEQERKILDSRR